MNQVVVSLGSNVAPEENIQRARQLLAGRYEVCRESDFIWTEPVDCPPGMPDFLNGVVLLRTSLPAGQLKEDLRCIERQLERWPVRRPSPGVRGIDLDIVVWNGKVVDTDFYRRRFLRELTLSILPDLSF